MGSFKGLYKGTVGFRVWGLGFRFLHSAFCIFYFGVSLLKPNIGKKGTLIVKGLLGTLTVTAGLPGLGLLLLVWFVKHKHSGMNKYVFKGSLT